MEQETGTLSCIRHHQNDHDAVDFTTTIQSYNNAEGVSFELCSNFFCEIPVHKKTTTYMLILQIFSPRFIYRLVLHSIGTNNHTTL